MTHNADHRRVRRFLGTAALMFAIPLTLVACSSDDNAEVSNNGALANSASLTARGVSSVALLHAATPLFDERFVRVAGVSTTQSRALAAELRAAGCLDADQRFTQTSSEIVSLATAAPGRFPTLAALTATQQRDVISQIAVMRAEHEMFSDWASRTLRWFAAYP